MKKILFIFSVMWAINAFSQDSSSNITIRNSSDTTTYKITGFYIQQLSTGPSCDALAGNVDTPSHGFSYGVMWKPVSLSPDEKYEIGANLLYQMMNNLLFQTYQGSGTDCTPGVGNCTMSAAPSTNQWCVRVGLIKGSPMLTTGAIAGANDLLTTGESQRIKITCKDSATTCKANSAVTQNIP